MSFVHENMKRSQKLNKISLSANDDKRIIQPDKINTLAYGFRAWGAQEDGNIGANWGHEGNWQRDKGLQLNGPKAWKSAFDVGHFSSSEYNKQSKK